MLCRSPLIVTARPPLARRTIMATAESVSGRSHPQDEGRATTRFIACESCPKTASPTSTSLPYSIRVLLESCLRNVDNFIVNESDVVELANWNAGSPKTGRSSLQARAGRAAGLHRRAGDRRPGRPAQRDGAHGGRSEEDQSAGALRSGDRPFGAGRSVRDARSRCNSTSRRNSSGTSSGTSSCAGGSRRSTISASCRRRRASSTR